MLIDSPLVSRGSGSLAGLTMSHNRGGLYLRARTIPTNPNTVQQQAVRSFVSQLSSLWASSLTQLERDKWTIYADNVPLTNALGDPIFVTGLNMYVRSNVPILQAGFARQDDAPGIFDLGDYTPVVVTAVAVSDSFFVTFTDTDDWVGEDDAAMLIYTSRPNNPSINFFKGPYRFAGSIDGDSLLPPTTPAEITGAFVFETGQKMFGRVQVIRADGRLSADQRFESIAA